MWVDIFSKYIDSRNSSIRIGGICGQITSRLVKNSYNTTNVSTQNNFGISIAIGWCVGLLSFDAELRNSYNLGIITENNNKTVWAGSIVDSNLQSSSIVSNCYSLYGTYGVGIGNKNI